MTKKTNEHVSDYLKWYISEECEKPRFAVLVKGGWGSGKTWFAKKFMQENDNKQTMEEPFESKFIYISLYGVEEIGGIDDRIFQSLHPALSGKTVSCIGRMAKSFFSKHVADVSEFSLTDYMKKTKGKILVFDDLERCSIQVEEVFGYINSIVEHQLEKVIIIANEEGIESGLEDKEKKQDPKYHQIKEKVIGKTFKVESDTPTVVDSLIKENAQVSKEVLLERKNLLIEILELVKNKTDKKHVNYRAFAHVIRNFEYLWKQLKKEYTEYNEFITEFLNEFVRLDYELQLGLITEQDICSIEGAEMARIMASVRKGSVKEDGSKENKHAVIEGFLDRHPLNSDNMILPPLLWARILGETQIDIKAIYDRFNNTQYFKDNTRPDWKSLWRFRELEDDKCSEVIESVSEKLKTHECDEIGELFHIYGSLLRLVEEGFVLPEEIGNTFEAIEEHAKAYIDYLYAADKLPKRSIEVEKYMDTAHGFLSYPALNLDSFKSIRSYFAEKCHEKISKLEAKETGKLLNCMVNDTREFYGVISTPEHNRESSGMSYWNIPIFKNIDPLQFFSSYRKTPNANKRWVSNAFKERYKYLNHHALEWSVSSNEAREELDFMRKLLEVIDDTVSKALSVKPSIQQMKDFKSEGLKIAIEELEKCIKSQALESSDELLQ